MQSRMISLQNELSLVLKAPSLRFDEQNCADHRLESGQRIHVRCAPDVSGCWIAAPLGHLRREHLPQRALTLLMANHQGLAFGGAYGYDAARDQVFVSRYFPLADGANFTVALNQIRALGLSLEAATALLAIVNAINWDESGKTTIPGVDLDVATRASVAALEACSPEPDSADSGPALTALEGMLSEAVRYCGISFSGLDDDRCWHAQSSDGITLQVAVDPLLESFVLMTTIGRTDDAQVLEHAADWLGANLFVRGTGNCVLGIAQHAARSEFLVTLSLLTSLSALGPSPVGLGNLIAGVFSNAQRIRAEVDTPLGMTSCPA